MPTITLKNGLEQEIFPYYDTYEIHYETILIHVYKRNITDELAILHCPPQNYKHLAHLITYSNLSRNLMSYDIVSQCRYNPNSFKELVTSHHDYNLFGTIEISTEFTEHYYKEHPEHSFYFETYYTMGAGSSDRLIDTYVRANAEIWRVHDNGNPSPPNKYFRLYKSCNTCDGTGKVYYNRGKRTIKRIIKKCPMCKGKESRTIII